MDIATYTPGEWYLEPGDDGDPSVGLDPSPMTICVAAPADSALGAEIVLATLHDPCYSIAVAEDADLEGDWPERWLGSALANGRLMTASPKLFKALAELTRVVRSRFEGLEIVALVPKELKRAVESAEAAMDEARIKTESA